MVNSGIDWANVQFTKSSYSGTDGGNCVEIGVTAGIVGLRDSKLGTSGPVLELTGSGFGAFLTAIKAGMFDHA